MKKTIFFGAISIAVMFAAAGCGKDTDEVKGSGSSTVLPKAVKTVDITARKRVLEAEMAALAQYGLDANKTTDTQASAHYLIEIKDAQKTAQALLVWLNAGNTTPRDRKIFVTLFENMKYFGMDVDWEKYAKNKPQSVFVYETTDKAESTGRLSLLWWERAAHKNRYQRY